MKSYGIFILHSMFGLSKVNLYDSDGTHLGGSSFKSYEDAEDAISKVDQIQISPYNDRAFNTQPVPSRSMNAPFVILELINPSRK